MVRAGARIAEPAADERFPWTIRYNVDSLLDALRPDHAVQGAVAADWNSRRAPTDVVNPAGERDLILCDSEALSILSDGPGVGPAIVTVLW